MSLHLKIADYTENDCFSRDFDKKLPAVQQNVIIYISHIFIFSCFGGHRNFKIHRYKIVTYLFEIV